jgi:hypothetical protein
MMHCLECGVPIFHPKKKYCSRRCSDRVAQRRRTRKLQDSKPPEYFKISEDRKIRAREWRKRMEEEGRCNRCGEENDYKEFGLKRCSKCRMEADV